MTSRTYLSIGDVLTLLREEFPDVTISKIRFLESQGLVNPERSPSGYRKFFETDVERLRWVLRQQREHFLPLKVIRDRLADGELEGGAGAGVGAGAGAESATRGNGKSLGRTHAVAGAVHAAGASGAGSGAGGGGASGAGSGAGLGTATAPRTAEQSTQADDEAMARILADASRRVSRVPESAGAHALLEAVPDPGAPTPPGPSDVLDVPRAHDLPRPTDASGLRTDPDAPANAAAGRHAAAGATSASPPPSVVTAAPPDVAGAADVTGAAAATSVPASPRPTDDVFTRAAASAVGVPPSAAATPRRADEHATSGNAQAATPRSDSARAGGGNESGGGVATSPGAGGAGGPATAGKPAGATGKGGGAARERAEAAPSSTTSGMVTGASLTSEELCAASGLSEIEIAGLQGFGLIEPVMVAGIPTFDEDDLTVANLAAEFRKFGIEARHLRPYRNAVDREMGLIEQVIIPLLRQRNPESRQRAVDAADELGALGQTMRATLLRTALRRHVGG
jgi:DNA-binding transcriptional MerR regulator